MTHVPSLTATPAHRRRPSRFATMMMAALLPALSGCGYMLLSGENMRRHCAPDLLQHMRANAYGVAAVSVGSSQADVYATLGEPETTSTVATPVQGMFQVWFYRVSHPNCRGENTFAPVVFQNNTVVGTGTDFYRSTVAPFAPLP